MSFTSRLQTHQSPYIATQRKAVLPTTDIILNAVGCVVSPP